MRRDDDGGVRLSASDLMRFQACAHASALDLRRLRGEPLQPADDAAGAVLLQAKGEAHEAAYLATARSDGDVVEIPKDDLSLADAAALTRQAMAEGARVIYQATFDAGPWGGYADFLERVDRPSALGGHSYEAVDTKLKRTATASHALQLALYSDLLGEAQGAMPRAAHVLLGTGARVTLPLADCRAYARRLRRRLEGFVAAPPPTRPEPVEACGLCRWRERCADEWRAADSLVRVAGILRGQRRKLELAGVTTMSALAARTRHVPDLSNAMLAKLRGQARLQAARDRGGPPTFDLRPFEAGRGLLRLPRPAAGDVFFDMEGDPFVEDGLEYLFGVCIEAEGSTCYAPFWAHGRTAERDATEQVLRLFAENLRQHPDAHIYHYNHYEVSALRRLAMRHGVGEAVLDDLLRRKRFVDLYRVVQQGLVVSEPGYSLKDLEAFYMPARADAVATAADSVVAYERWRETGDDEILEQIRAYNETDCRSTLRLRDWLVQAARPADLPWLEPGRRDEADAPDPKAEAAEAARAVLRDRLAGLWPRLGAEAADLLFELCFFHAREDKPGWWAVYDRVARDTDELIDDLDSLGGLEAAGPAEPDKRSLVRRYRVPPQETKLRAGDPARVAVDGTTRTVTLEALDWRRHLAAVKFGSRAGEPPDRIDLLPAGPLQNEVLRDAVLRAAGDLAEEAPRFRALADLMLRRPPRLAAGARLPTGADRDLIAATCAAIAGLDDSVLPIQGPPGTGKTFVASHAILHLLRQGRRVAVASHAHKAIDNLLLAVAARAREAGYPLEAVKKNSRPDGGPDDALIAVTLKNDDARLAEYELVGGTAWLFARPEHELAFDDLFVDEAGQVSLANLVAMATAASNLVLIGDPLQLPQPIQGAHPGESGLSALDHVLEGYRTVPPDRGVFLPETRRMHPAICRFVSETVYEGRLGSAPGTARQRLLPDGSGIPASGLAFVEVPHEGNRQSSDEEVAAVRDLVGRLVGRGYVDRDGAQRPLALADILVVAPYNAQVNALAGALPAGARVGTVDRFQGQEAPVAILSMATSSGEDMPRDIDFLFNMNRLNVAISRAQALAVIVASPRLLDVPCKRLDQVRQVNMLCAAHAQAVVLQGALARKT